MRHNERSDDMHVYFVRHGETDLNIRNRHQSPSTPLNERGFDQARSVGEYLRPMNATLLISSTYERAAQTARVVGSRIGLVPHYAPLFREIVRPSAFTELSLYSFRNLWFLFLSVLWRNKPSWRYQDSENFSDIFSRVRKSFQHIESLTEAHDTIIVVSHSAYISLMISYMCHGENLSLREVVTTYLNINQLKNCGVIHVEYTGPVHKGSCAWVQH